MGKERRNESDDSILISSAYVILTRPFLTSLIPEIPYRFCDSQHHYQRSFLFKSGI